MVDRTGLTSIDDLIHTQTSKIGLLAAEITKTLASPELATQERIAALTKKLEAWQAGVPSMLLIPALTSPNPPVLSSYQRRAILMVHVRSAPPPISAHNVLIMFLDDVSGSCGPVVPSLPYCDSNTSERGCSMELQHFSQRCSKISGRMRHSSSAYGAHTRATLV